MEFETNFFQTLVNQLECAVMFREIPSGLILFANDAVLSVFGHPKEKFLENSKFIEEICHSDFYQGFLKFHHDNLEGNIRNPFEYQIIGSDNNIRWIKQQTKKYHDNQGKFVGIQISCENITTVKYRETQLAYLDKASTEGIILSKDGFFLSLNRQAVRMLGYEKSSELIGKNYVDFISPEFNKTVHQHMVKEIDGRYEAILKKKDGTTFPVKIEGRRVEFNGEMIRAASVIDITREREYESNFVDIVNTVKSIILKTDPDGNITFINKFGEEFFGFDPDELIGQHMLDTIVPHIDSTGTNLKPMIADLSTNPEKYTENINENQKKNGERVWIAWSNKPITDHEGNQVGLLSVGIDLTDRKLAEEKLKTNEANLKLAEAIANFGYWEYFIQTHKLKTSEEFNQIFDLNTEAEITPELLFSIYHPDDKERITRLIQKMINGENVPDITEYRIIDSRGKVKTLWSMTKLYKDQNNNPVKIFGTIQDISNQKKLTDQLKKQRDFNELIIEASPAFFVAINKEGKTIMMNRKMRETLKYKLEEVVGKNYLQNFIPKEEQQYVSKIFENMINHPNPTLSENYIISKDGKKYLTEWHGQPIFNDENELDFFVGYGIDITQRRKYEILLEKEQNDLKKSLQEKDVLLKEIHHRVKNNLQIISSLIRLQKPKISDDKTLQINIDFQNRVKTMSLIHETLYRSDDLGKLDFGNYIQNLVSNLFRTYQKSPELIHLEIDIDDFELNLDQAISCGLIINEIISNALKYAFPEKSRGTIFIKAKKRTDNKIELIAGDTGIGIPKEINLEKTETLGLQLIIGLAKQLGGTIKVYRNFGTKFHIIFMEE
ncbi:hypothetical protein NEF87_004772 [Candidatus Lokiarchaeum ossiferum]|uniref:PAS domain S-box protein n=1 Tax=Candidatus Lokiarchaeum ossiferum TaxID=2951803 RepID=A0ABY6I1N8_9ARCH|nr:hypothetical protein NEF87_004772 [Candidatus Lokiarchaeum sp. B-35]